MPSLGHVPGQDARILRDRQGAHSDAIDNAKASHPNACKDCFVGQTTYVSSYPTSAQSFFAVIPCDVNGDETEGGTATLVPRANTILFALNVGTSTPPVGTTITVFSVGGRNVFRYDG